MNHYRHWKFVFDSILAIVLIVLLLPVMILLLAVAAADTRSCGIFFQKRVGRSGEMFTIYKFRTIKSREAECSGTGAFFRKFKLDELPQLFNILKGDMSFVGPRPDVEGYYDRLSGKDRNVLQLRPGITSEASIKYSNEEEILKAQKNPLQYNDEVVFPDKIKMNLQYLENMSFSGDMKILMRTVLRIFFK
ncbi:sugar transferase [uncultured Chryseobacterium sp.]|uniref:sugar transferase n=1 Tax=uncultured Chryseobacterium sp. TaxID=259322 RepID=UPI0025D08663|nr:sugar transferase [uncultured Chryseobacterium sp.]